MRTNVYADVKEAAEAGVAHEQPCLSHQCYFCILRLACASLCHAKAICGREELGMDDWCVCVCVCVFEKTKGRVVCNCM